VRTEHKPAPLKLVRSLMDMPLPKDACDADLAFTDRYRPFFAGMLRPSLAGIGVFGSGRPA